MKISEVPITHRIKHLQPIFSITKGSKYFCSGGVNGEMKLWDLSYDHVKTVKKHSGAVSCVRFSLDSRFIASAGDDGRVFIFDQDAKNVLKTIRHPCDVTHLEWTPDFLISSNLDGQVRITKILDFSEFRILENHKEGILGMGMSQDFVYLCTYSENLIVLYENFNVKAKRKIEKGGVILENLQCKVSFSPNSKFISVGLQFNCRVPTVDIFDLGLNTVFSLAGHVAPCEITAFCPHVLKNIKQYCVLAVASQDLSLSLWNTLNPKPFVLLKNFTEMPILDMLWDGLTLYISSYDGVVKKVEFEERELGEMVEEIQNEEEFEMPFCDMNIEMQKSYERRVERLDFDEKIEVMRLSGFSINGTCLEELLNSVVDSREASNREASGQEDGGASAKSSFEAVAKDGPRPQLLTDGPQKSTGWPDSDRPSSGRREETTPDGVLPDAANATKTSKGYQGILPENALVPKPKRISPVMIDKPKSAPIFNNKGLCSVVLFDTNQPEKLKLIKTDPFKLNLDDFTVELKEHGDVCVYRASRLFYRISGPCSKVCFNDRYVVVYTSYVQIYELSTGILLLPFINTRLSYLDVLDNQILLLDSYGDFTVLKLSTKEGHRSGDKHSDRNGIGCRAVTGKLPKTRNLSKIQLSKSHFLVAEYSGDEIVFYHKRMKTWFTINPRFNSITTSGIDFYNDYDDTIAELELSFVHYLLLGDAKNMKAVVKQFVALLKRTKKLEDHVEYKIAHMINSIEDKKFVSMVLEELNRECVFQRFVIKMTRQQDLHK